MVKDLRSAGTVLACRWLAPHIKFEDGINFAFKFDNFDPRVKAKPSESN